MTDRPKRYRSKVAEVDAIKWDGSITSAYAIENWSSRTCERRGQPLALAIATPESWMRADPSDYIVKGSHGLFYPLKHDIFAMQFEPIGEDPKV